MEKELGSELGACLYLLPSYQNGLLLLTRSSILCAGRAEHPFPVWREAVFSSTF